MVGMLLPLRKVPLGLTMAHCPEKLKTAKNKTRFPFLIVHCSRFLFSFSSSSSFHPPIQEHHHHNHRSKPGNQLSVLLRLPQYLSTHAHFTNTLFQWPPIQLSLLSAQVSLA